MLSPLAFPIAACLCGILILLVFFCIMQWFWPTYLSPLFHSGLSPVGDVERGSKSYLRNRYGEILPVYRRNSHREVQAGSHEYPGEGIYLLKFDNSYSLLRNKTLFFHIYYTSWRRGKGQGWQAGNGEGSRLPPSPVLPDGHCCVTEPGAILPALLWTWTGFFLHPSSPLSQGRKVVVTAWLFPGSCSFSKTLGGLLHAGIGLGLQVTAGNCSEVTFRWLWFWSVVLVQNEVKIMLLFCE